MKDLYSVMTPKRLLSGLLLFAAMLPAEVRAEQAETERDFSYMPEVHGAMRSRYEVGVDDEGARFQVRNVRVSLSGRIAPSIDYFVQTDLCELGKTRILDAWGRIAITDKMAFQAGQFRMPFGTDCFRGPANFIFANRSFIGKQMCNVRAVGAKLTYTVAPSDDRKLLVEGGAFNPTVIDDHGVWVKELSYAARVIYTAGDIKLATGVQSIEPDSVRANLWGASVTWSPGPLTLEGEYIHKHYTHSSHRAAHGWVLWADYGMPIKAGVFNRASFQARWDGLTPHSDGRRNADGMLVTTHKARNRVTVGGTLTYAYKALHCDLRLNFEKYFYHSGVAPATGDWDKICAEMVIRF